MAYASDRSATELLARLPSSPAASIKTARPTRPRVRTIMVTSGGGDDQGGGQIALGGTQAQHRAGLRILAPQKVANGKRPGQE